jgi:hypothetical protein
MSRNSLLSILISSTLTLIGPGLAAGEEVDGFIEYQQILRDLEREGRLKSRLRPERPTEAASSRVRSQAAWPKSFDLSLNEVQFHLGVGWGLRAQSLNLGEINGTLVQQGLQFSLGIDLLSSRWLAEGTARSFDGLTTNSNDEAQARLREFELKLVRRLSGSSAWSGRISGGVSARYLTVTSSVASEMVEESTPAGLIGFGASYGLSPMISLGVETTARWSLLASSRDQSSVDATVRLDTHF